jgi:hypothetical protein
MADGDHSKKPDATSGKDGKSVEDLDKSVKQLLGVPQKEIEGERKPPGGKDR